MNCPLTRRRDFFAQAGLIVVMVFLLSQCALANRPRTETVIDEREDHMFSLITSALQYVKNGQYREAVRTYEEAIRIKPSPSDISGSKARRWAQNNLAWLLSTCPDGSVRDGERAIALAKEILAVVPHDVAYLDTLGAALAETGQFEEAERVVRQALSNVPQRVPKSHATVVQLNKHLDSYKDRRPWREP